MSFDYSLLKRPEDCRWEDCNKRRVQYGNTRDESALYCAAHQSQYYRHGEEGMTYLREYQKTHSDTCTFEGCERKYYARDLCKAHYDQDQRGYELKPIRERKKTNA